ncbi:MAG: transglutaminase domain-containing protein [Bacteroidia bacterium]
MQSAICYGQQEIICHKVYSIADTSKSKPEQVHEIYNWITHHVKYDVKSYIKGNHENKPAVEVLKKHKGLCSDYSLLFDEMCKCINVESQTVTGYSKGVDYYKGGKLYRADHSWNAFFTDSSWVMVDATWGSGYVASKYKWIDIVLHKLIKSHKLKLKYYFVKKPDDSFFNPDLNFFYGSHLPLDSNWQQTVPSITLQQFENDSLQNNLPVLSKISATHVLESGECNRTFVEGINGKLFNPKNDFNIAVGKLNLARCTNYQTMQVDTLNYGAFVRNRDLYSQSLIHLNQYSSSIDSVYHNRLKKIKGYNNEALRVYKTTLNEIRYQEKKFTRQKLKEEKMLARLNKENQNIAGFIGMPDLWYRVNDKINLKDTMPCDARADQFKKVSTEINRLGERIDSLIIEFSKAANYDSTLSIDCINYKSELNRYFTGFNPKIITDDNLVIFSYWEQLYITYTNLQYHAQLKQSNFVTVQKIHDQVITHLSLIENDYFKLYQFIKQKPPCRNNLFNADSALNVLKKSINEKASGILNSSDAYRQWLTNSSNYNSQRNEMIIELQQSEAIENLPLFNKYCFRIFSIQERIYRNEKVLTKEVMSEAQKSYAAINLLIGNYNAHLKRDR